MLADLIKASGMSETEILSQVRDESDIWLAFAEPIRKEFDKETKLFNYQKKNKNKIWDSTLFNVHSAMMAREYIDKPTSKFDGTYWQLNLVKNLNIALDIDFNDSYMENHIYDRKHDKFLRWIWISIRNWWDWVNKRNSFDIVDPRLAVLDPDGNYRTWEYSYFWFQKVEFFKNLENWKDFENLDKVNTQSSSGDAVSLREKDQENFKLSAKRKNSNSNPAIETYYHFSDFNWVRALVILANDRRQIIKVKIYKENKRVPMFDDILAITYWRPRKNNPFWDRMPRYVGDVQMIKSIVANLRLDKIRAELYPMYIRNTRLIKNKADLDFGFNKVIDANPLEWESLNNALTPVPRDLRTDQSHILDNSLDKQIEASTSIWKVAQWTTPERREAATTNKLIQDSTDINLAFTAKIDAIWYEKLLKVWLEGYLENFKAWDKKIVYIQTGFWTMARPLGRKDFLTDTAVKIKIETRIEIDERKQKDRLAYWQLISYLQTLPWRPAAAQLNTLRNFARSMDMSEENIEMEIPATAQEIIAEQNAWVLLQGKVLNVKMDYDPDTHLMAIKSLAWEPNVETYKYELLKLKKIKWETTGQSVNPAMANNMVAQATAQTANEITAENAQ